MIALGRPSWRNARPILGRHYAFPHGARGLSRSLTLTLMLTWWFRWKNAAG